MRTICPMEPWERLNRGNTLRLSLLRERASERASNSEENTKHTSASPIFAGRSQLGNGWPTVGRWRPLGSVCDGAHSETQELRAASEQSGSLKTATGAPDALFLLSRRY